MTSYWAIQAPKKNQLLSLLEQVATTKMPLESKLITTNNIINSGTGQVATGDSKTTAKKANL